MTERARQRAAACFRLANDERAPQGERDAARRQGERLVKRYGLDMEPDRPDPTPGHEWADAMQEQFADMPVFTMDDLVRGAVDEYMRRKARARDRGDLQ